MSTSHGVLQGYNANAIVDEKHQIVLHAEAFGKGGDSSIMEPMLKGAKEKLESAGWKEALKWMLYCLVHNIEKIINYGTSYNMALI